MNWFKTAFVLGSLGGTLCAQNLQVGLDLQLGLEQLAPRSLEINPPSGFLKLESAASHALALRVNWELWKPSAAQALELTGAYRGASERQLTYTNSVPASGDVAARLRLDPTWSLGALYRFERTLGLRVESGMGLEQRFEKLDMVDGGLHSQGSLSRTWLRGVLRHRFQHDGLGPFVALEFAIPLKHASTPSGVDYLDDVDHLGASTHPGTAATAHAPTYALTWAAGWRFGRKAAPEAPVQAHVSGPAPELPRLTETPRVETIPVDPPTSPVPVPVPTPVPVAKPDTEPHLEPPVVPQRIILDEAALHFALDRFEIPPSGKTLLKGWATRIKAQVSTNTNTNIKGLPKAPHLTVIGHTDSTGSVGHNRWLSMARARAVAEVLKAEGLVIDDIQGKGSTEPLDGDPSSNRTIEGRARNRRVEVHLSTPDADVKGRTASDLVTESAK